MSLATLRGLSPTWQAALTATEYAIVVLFTIEYGLRIVTAENNWWFVRSF